MALIELEDQTDVREEVEPDGDIDPSHNDIDQSQCIGSVAPITSFNLQVFWVHVLFLFSELNFIGGSPLISSLSLFDDLSVLWLNSTKFSC